jgi:nitrite reductase (NADH) small subunit
MPTYSIGPLTQIPPGEGRNFLVGETIIAVFHTRDGAIFATQAYCPHRNGPLADGLVDGQSVICPLHDRAFAFSTGQGIGNDCAIITYPAHIGADGEISLDI